MRHRPLHRRCREVGQHGRLRRGEAPFFQQRRTENALASLRQLASPTAQVTRGVPAPLVEHDELRCLDAGDWLAVPWLDADVPIVRALAASLAAR